ncbi:hypothetical protein [Arthrobacter sp. Bz4]|uniref:hypothetical protein n=1 Tax=Arthrobacter sp. Bz4 TaxID=2171979 RepID=UPI001057211E|nr:hypothetical protein [Arthrobacter sp. Bz4]
MTSDAWVDTMQSLVWNPMAAVPGSSLDEIWDAMLAANEPLAHAQVDVFPWGITSVVSVHHANVSIT